MTGTQEQEQDFTLVGLAKGARVLGINYQTLRRWTRKGLVPKPMVINNRPRWLKAELLAAFRRDEP